MMSCLLLYPCKTKFYLKNIYLNKKIFRRKMWPDTTLDKCKNIENRNVNFTLTPVCYSKPIRKSKFLKQSLNKGRPGKLSSLWWISLLALSLREKIHEHTHLSSSYLSYFVSQSLPPRNRSSPNMHCLRNSALDLDGTSASLSSSHLFHKAQLEPSESWQKLLPWNNIPNPVLSLSSLSSFSYKTVERANRGQSIHISGFLRRRVVIHHCPGPGVAHCHRASSVVFSIARWPTVNYNDTHQSANFTSQTHHPSTTLNKLSQFLFGEETRQTLMVKEIQLSVSIHP